MRTNSQHSFARLLGRAPRCKVRGRVTEHVDAFVEAFGPPETLKWKSMRLLFWNFKRQDGAIGFSLLVLFPIKEKPEGEINVDVASVDHRDFDTFMSWVLDRTGSVLNGEDAPRFLNGAHFVAVPA